MAAQISDQFIYQKRNYELIASEHGDLFVPTNHGFHPIMLNTACWRGYYGRYAIVRERLVLAMLHIGLDPGSPPPVWLGVVPRKEGFFRSSYAWEYPDVNLPIRYTGGIVIGRDFIREFNDYAEFHRTSGYRTVIELNFEDGRLAGTVDHSRTMEAIREKIRDLTDLGRTERIGEILEDAFAKNQKKKWF